MPAGPVAGAAESRRCLANTQTHEGSLFIRITLTLITTRITIIVRMTITMPGCPRRSSKVPFLMCCTDLQRGNLSHLRFRYKAHRARGSFSRAEALQGSARWYTTREIHNGVLRGNTHFIKEHHCHGAADRTTCQEQVVSCVETW